MLLYGILFLLSWVIAWSVFAFFGAMVILFFNPKMHSIYEAGPFSWAIVLIVALILGGIAAFGAISLPQDIKRDKEYKIIFQRFFGMSPYSIEYDEDAVQSIIDRVLARLSVCLFDAFRENDLNLEIENPNQFSPAELEEIIIKANDAGLQKIIDAQRQYASAVTAATRFGYKTNSDWADYLPSKLRETIRENQILVLNPF